MNRMVVSPLRVPGLSRAANIPIEMSSPQDPEEIKVTGTFIDRLCASTLLTSFYHLPHGSRQHGIHCAHLTSTFSACAFREQEDDQAILPIPRVA
jgi:hypothetical protein